MCWEIALFSFSARSRGGNAQPSITVMDGLVEIPSKSICIRHICHFVMHLIGRKSFLMQRRQTLFQLLLQLGSVKMLHFSFQGGEFPVRCAFWSSLSAMTLHWLWACPFFSFFLFRTHFMRSSDWWEDIMRAICFDRSVNAVERRETDEFRKTENATKKKEGV